MSLRISVPKRVRYASLNEYWPAVRARAFVKALGKVPTTYVRNLALLAAHANVPVNHMPFVNPITYAERLVPWPFSFPANLTKVLGEYTYTRLCGSVTLSNNVVPEHPSSTSSTPESSPSTPTALGYIVVEPSGSAQGVVGAASPLAPQPWTEADPEPVDPEAADLSEMAVSVFEKTIEAALDMDLTSQYNLGCYYRLGFGVQKDDVKAAYWFCVAAGAGDVNAQYNLGNCYRFGVGVEPNNALARFWYKLAADQGHTKAHLYLTTC
jgi:hypothetical protein